MVFLDKKARDFVRMINKNCCLQQSDHPKLSIKLSFSNTQEAASQFLSVKACHPPSESAHQKSASALTSPSHKPCVSPFSFFFFFFRMNSWIIRSWIWVSSTDANLKIGVSNVGHCLCFRFVGSFFIGIPLAELTEQLRRGNKTRLGKSVSFTYSTRLVAILHKVVAKEWIWMLLNKEVQSEYSLCTFSVPDINVWK